MKKFEIGILICVSILLLFLLPQNVEALRWIGNDLHFATLERQVMQNEIIVVGTIQSVETQLVDKSFSSTQEWAPGKRFEYQELVPYFFVTIDVEQYLLDKTGKFLPQITFRDLAGGSGIYNGESMQMYYPYRINYTSGEKALFIIHLWDHDYFYSIGYQQKFSFFDDDKLQNQSFKKHGYEPFTINQINNEIETFFNSYPPKKLLDFGVVNSEIRCKIGLELIFKSTDGSPACVKPSTSEKLVERGWASS